MEAIIASIKVYLAEYYSCVGALADFDSLKAYLVDKGVPAKEARKVALKSLYRFKTGRKPY